MGIDFLKLLRLRLKPASSANNAAKGDMEVLDSDGKLYTHNGTTSSAVVTETHAQNITGKTLLEVDNLQLNGNTIASTNTNGDIIIDPNGDGNITLTTSGTGILSTNSAMTIGSTTIQSTTISTVANNNLTLSPGGTGSVVVTTDLDVDNLNINGNTISATNADGDVIITPLGNGDTYLNVGAGGGSRAYLGSTNIQATGAGAMAITGSLDVDSLKLDGSTISQNSAGSITITPSGTNAVIISTKLAVDNITIDANTISSTDTNGNVVLDPNGTGIVSVESALRIPEVATPTTPSSGYGNIYFKTDGSLYQQSDDGSERKIGNAAINYILNPDASGATTGWATFADAAATSPVDGTGGSPNSTWTRTTSSPLRGDGSFLFTKSSGASRQGEGVSYDFTIDSADQGAVLRLSFDYVVASGTFVDNDMQVWLYDVTNSTLIQPAPTYILNVSTTSSFKGEFQTAINSTSYRLILYVPVTTDSANTIKFDNFYLGPASVAGVIPKAPTVQRLTSGTAATYTRPDGVKFIKVKMIGAGGGGSGSGTASASSNGTAGGDTLWKDAAGSTTIVTAAGGAGGVWGGGGGTGGNVTINSPAVSLIAATGNSGVGSGYTNADFRSPGGAGGAGAFGGGAANADQNAAGTSGVANTGSGGQGGSGNSTTGSYVGHGGGAGGYAEFIINNPTSTYTYTVGAVGTKGAAGTSGFAGGDGASGVIIVEEHYVGTNTLMSNDTDTRVVAAKFTTTDTTAIATAASGTIVWNGTTFDTHAGKSGNTYVVPVPGKYRVSGHLTLASAAYNASTYVCAFVMKNGASVGQKYFFPQTAATYLATLDFDTLVDCVAGDILRIDVSNASGSNKAPDGTALENILNIERISGPAQIAASETVAVRAALTTSTTGIASQVAVFNSETVDTHGAYNNATGIFTAPISGLYQVNARLLFGSLDGATNVTMRIRKNSTSFHEAYGSMPAAGTTTVAQAAGSDLVRLLAGDTVDIYANGDASFSLDNNGDRCTFSIIRVGNY